LKIKKPYFIGEISANYASSFIRAKNLIRCTHFAGADAAEYKI